MCTLFLFKNINQKNYKKKLLEYQENNIENTVEKVEKNSFYTIFFIIFEIFLICSIKGNIWNADFILNMNKNKNEIEIGKLYTYVIYTI